MKKIIGLLFILATYNVRAFCQQGLVNARPTDNFAHMMDAFEAKYKEVNKKGQLQICLASVTFAKFTVDTLGNINNLSFYENPETPAVFREILTYAIQSSNGSWIPGTLNGKKVESKPFILPLMYQLEASCKTSAPAMQTDNALEHFLIDVTKASNGPFDCLFLSPLSIVSQK